MFRTKRNINGLRAKADLEDNQPISVGGLMHRLQDDTNKDELYDSVKQHAFAKFVELSRRRLQLSIEELASMADVDPAELTQIELGLLEAPEPRTVYQLAKILKVKREKLMELSGLMLARDSHIGGAAVRFAARSESMANLSKEEEQALREFVAQLSRD